MTLNILRWRGGSGGDMLLNLISNSSDVLTNTKFQSGLSTQGGTILDFSHVNLDHLRQIDRIALGSKYRSTVDMELLKQELDKIIVSEQTWWLKSHCYEQKIYTDHIIDIVVSEDLLPFAVEANINKTPTLRIDFDPIVSKITNPSVRYQYSVYSVAKDFISPHNTNRTIQLKQILSGWDQLTHTLKLLNIELNSTLIHLYQDWLTRNIKYVPTSTYQLLAQAQDYDINNHNLTLIERYCLLALSGRKFQLLDKNKI
jgi:hypothetical protein